MSQARFTTEQEEFWAGEFGSDYIRRNQSAQLFAANLAFFTNALHGARDIGSCIEFGANVGMNLRAIKALLPEVELHAIEINPDAAAALREALPESTVFEGSFIEWGAERTYDLVLAKGVLIHVNPDALPAVYDNLAAAASRFLLVAEYYNPSPVSIPYRGHGDRLFKRDFAGEILDRHPDFALRDYGFAYHRDPKFPQDDITWFLLERVPSDPTG